MLTAGYARVCISPVAGMPLAGFAARAGACEGVHDDLFARALVLDNGRRTLALVSLDLLAVPATFVGRVAVIDRLRLVDRHRLVSYQGVVLESCAAAREAFVRVLGQGVHRVRVEAPRHEPIIGAYMLGRRALNWPAMDFHLEPRT